MEEFMKKDMLFFVFLFILGFIVGTFMPQKTNQLTGRITLGYCPDVNSDGMISLADAMLIARAFNQSNCPSYNCDLNKDGIVTEDDAKLVVLNFGKYAYEITDCVAITHLGALAITTAPSGSGTNLYIDNVLKITTTPYTLRIIKAGTHELKITKTGYEDYISTINVQEGQVNELNAVLVPKAPNADACYDNDGNGVGYDYSYNIFVKGTSSGYKNGEAYSSTDYCIDGNNIMEYYCIGGINTYSIQAACPWGNCVDGQCASQYSSTCSDSDNGKNYELKGTCKDNVGTYTDICSPTSGSVREMFCQGAQCVFQDYACPNGCFNGICISGENLFIEEKPLVVMGERAVCSLLSNGNGAGIRGQDGGTSVQAGTKSFMTFGDTMLATTMISNNLASITDTDASDCLGLSHKKSGAAADEVLTPDAGIGKSVAWKGEGANWPDGMIYIAPFVYFYYDSLARGSYTYKLTVPESNCGGQECLASTRESNPSDQTSETTYTFHLREHVSGARFNGWIYYPDTSHLLSKIEQRLPCSGDMIILNAAVPGNTCSSNRGMSVGLGLAKFDPNTIMQAGIEATRTPVFWDYDGYKVEGATAYLWRNYVYLFFNFRVGRVPVSQIEDMSKYTYWNGTHWTTNLGKAVNLWEQDYVNGISVAYNNYIGKFVAVYTDLFDEGPIGDFKVYARTASAITGPWSEEVLLQDCSKYQSGSGFVCYSGRQHPQFMKNNGQTIYVTYASQDTGSLHLNEVNFGVPIYQYQNSSDAVIFRKRGSSASSGFVLEGTVFYASEYSASSFSPIYEWQDSSTGKFIYSNSNPGTTFTNNGVAFYAPLSQMANFVPVYRWESPASNLYSVKDNLEYLGFERKEIAFYAKIS